MPRGWIEPLTRFFLSVRPSIHLQVESSDIVILDAIVGFALDSVRLIYLGYGGGVPENQTWEAADPRCLAARVTLSHSNVLGRSTQNYGKRKMNPQVGVDGAKHSLPFNSRWHHRT